MFRSSISRLTFNRINIFQRKDGEKIIVSKRRDMSYDGSRAGIKSFTKKANARNKAAHRAANRAANKRARVSRKRNRVS